MEPARVAPGAREPGGSRAGRPGAGAGRAGLPGSSASRARFGATPGASGAGGRGRPAGGVTSAGSGDRSSSGGYRASPRTGAAQEAGASGYRGSGAPYKSASVGGSYRGRSPSGSARPASPAGADASGSRYRGAREAVDRDAVPGRRAQAFGSSSQREGGRPSSRGGWDRPAPRRDGPAASRRGGPGMHREEEAQSDPDSGPLPSFDRPRRHYRSQPLAEATAGAAAGTGCKGRVRRREPESPGAIGSRIKPVRRLEEADASPEKFGWSQQALRPRRTGYRIDRRACFCEGAA